MTQVDDHPPESGTLGNQLLSDLDAAMQAFKTLKEEANEIQSFVMETDEDAQIVEMLFMQYQREQVIERALSQHRALMAEMSNNTIERDPLWYSAATQMPVVNVKEPLGSYGLGDIELPDLTPLKNRVAWGSDMSDYELIDHLDDLPDLRQELYDVLPDVTRHLVNQFNLLAPEYANAETEVKRQLWQLVTQPPALLAPARLMEIVAKHRWAGKFAKLLDHHLDSATTLPAQLKPMVEAAFNMLALVEEPSRWLTRIAFRLDDLLLRSIDEPDRQSNESASLPLLTSLFKHHAKLMKIDAKFIKFFESTRSDLNMDGWHGSAEMEVLTLVQDTDFAMLEFEKKLQARQSIEAQHKKWEELRNNPAVLAGDPDASMEVHKMNLAESRAERAIDSINKTLEQRLPPLFRLGDLREALPACDEMARAIENWPIASSAELRSALQQQPALVAVVKDLVGKLFVRFNTEAQALEQKLQANEAQMRSTFAQMDLTALSEQGLHTLMNAIKDHDEDRHALQSPRGVSARALLVERLEQEFAYAPTAAHSTLLKQLLNHVKLWRDSAERQQALGLVNMGLIVASVHLQLGIAPSWSAEDLADMQTESLRIRLTDPFLCKDGTVFRAERMLALVESLNDVPIAHRIYALDRFYEAFYRSHQTDQQGRDILCKLLETCTQQAENESEEAHLAYRKAVVASVANTMAGLPLDLQGDILFSAFVGAEQVPDMLGDAALTLAEVTLAPDRRHQWVVGTARTSRLNTLSHAVVLSLMLKEHPQQPSDRSALQGRINALLTNESGGMKKHEFEELEKLVRERFRNIPHSRERESAIRTMFQELGHECAAAPFGIKPSTPRRGAKLLPW